MGITGNVTSSGSTGQVVLSNVAITITSNAQTSSATYGRNVMRQTSGSNAMGMAANPNQGSWVTGVTEPSILTYSGSQSSGNYYAPIRFQPGDQYTDGRVTFKTPVVLEQSLTASLTEGYVWAGGVGNVTTLVATSSFAGGTINTGSFATTGSNTFVGNQTIDGSNKIGFGTTPNDVYINSPSNGFTNVDLNIINYSTAGGVTNILANNGVNINAVDTSVNITGKTGVNVYGDTSISGAMNITGSLTASLQQGYVWVGDVTGKTSLVSTSSFAGETINTGSFATTGSNTFVALQSINFSGTGTTLASSIVGNSTQVETDMYVDGGNYDTFNVFVSASNGIQLRDYSNTLNSVKPFISVATDAGELTLHRNTNISGNLDIQSTLTASLEEGYVWVGNASGKTTTVATSSFGGGGAAFPFTGNAVISGSLGITGSMFGGVVALSVVSATASVDFSLANMFTLTLPSASTHILPTNVRAGQTVNIQITQPTPGTGSVTFPSAVKFAGGNDYQATTTGSAIDMLTLVSYDGSNVLGTSIKNFL
jgi:hypothetical protein